MKKITGTTRHYITEEGRITCKDGTGSRAIIPDAAGRVTLTEGRISLTASVDSLLATEYPAHKRAAAENTFSPDPAPKRKKRKRKSKILDE